MKIVYKPGTEDEREWDWDANKMLDVEAIAIEKATGLTWAEFGEKFLKGSILARKALVWVLLKRDEPTLRHDSVSFTLDQLTVNFTPAERAQLIEALRKKDGEEGLDVDERQALDELVKDSADDDPVEAGPKED